MKGETVHIEINPEEAHVFSAETGRRVSGDVAPAGSATDDAAAGGATRLTKS
jgi:multiple sugar transport system ATP-binding protein